MKVLTNQYNPIMESAYSLAFDLEVFDPQSDAVTPECDAVICQGPQNLSVWLGRLKQDQIVYKRRKPRVILVNYENPHPFAGNKGVMSALSQHEDVDEVVFLNEHHQAMWGGVGTVIYPTVDFDSIPKWTGSDEKFIYSLIPNGMRMDWSRGFSAAVHVGIKPLLTKIHTGEPDITDENITKCRMYLNTSLLDPVPWGFLIAMAAGAPIVTTSTFITKKAFSVPGSYFGFMHNAAHGIRTTLLDCWQTKNFVEEFKERGMDEKLRGRARDLFNQDRFISLWEKLVGG